jgi:hypothetical protein
MTSTIYQIQIALRGLKPKIWRRILIPSDTLLSEFHEIIQITMGWENCHLHQFIKDGTYYSNENDAEAMFDSINYQKKKTRLKSLLTSVKEKIVYEYDFGDSWEHDIILEKIIPFDGNLRYPICITGKMHCPAEDSGGIYGYSNMLEILAQPDHEEYSQYLEWLGDEFDPEYFDKDEINELLRAAYP